jgi:hypothetical protein
MVLSYPTQPNVTVQLDPFNGPSPRIVHPDKLEGWKSVVESHLQALTTEIQTLGNHANWIEPRLQEFIKFNQWMEKAHPDIINAYKTSTAVADKLDRANNSDDSVMAETSA